MTGERVALPDRLAWLYQVESDTEDIMSETVRGAVLEEIIMEMNRTDENLENPTYYDYLSDIERRVMALLNNDKLMRYRNVPPYRYANGKDGHDG